MSISFDVEAYRREFSSFLKPGRVLLTGHSHQAWPDEVRTSLLQCFDEAAALVDDKWGDAIFPLWSDLSARIAVRMGLAPDAPLAFGRSTHELAYRLLSCLPPDSPPRIVTTTGEFHSLFRQLRRLEEDGAEVRWVDRDPPSTLVQRLVAEIGPDTDLVAVSAVLFEDAYVLEHVGSIAERAHEVGAICVLDGYHAFNVVPVDWGVAAEHAFLLGGGYKYAQFGEGLCWMSVPKGCSLRPRYTGWFADFASLDHPRASPGSKSAESPVTYSDGGLRFAGATFDPTALYRARAALDVFDRHGLDVAALREISTRQTTRLTDGLVEAGLAVASSVVPARRGGFVSVQAPRAAELVGPLRKRGVFVDARGDRLRLGPAPYLIDDELDEGVSAVVDVLRARG